MRKIVFALCMLTFCVASNAQLIKPKNHTEDSFTLDANGRLVKNHNSQKKALFSRDNTPIDEKYLAGACPVVNGKVQWDNTITTNKTAQQAYDIMLKYMNAFVKSNGQTKKSNVSLIEPTQHMIGSHLQEYLIFQNKALSLDQALMSYNLIITCSDNRVDVRIKDVSYTYEEERGGGSFPGEDMLLDSEALNKNKNGFHKGGYQKFRMKTIDRKDQIMNMIAEALK